MTALEARRVLELHRPWCGGEPDAETRTALALAKGDAELGRWYEGHCRFQEAIRRGLREVAVPAGLAGRVLGARRVVRPMAWWWKPGSVAMLAAGLVLLLGLGTVWWWRPAAGDRFENFRTRMVRTALRQYRMDIMTNDMGEVRRFLAGQGAPADYAVPAGLGRLKLTGGGRLAWRGEKVSMVCFDRGDGQMLFLFVLNRGALKDPPPESMALASLNRMTTLSWTRGNQAYLLAGPAEPGFEDKYR
jgi:hypothetical protein